MCLRVRRPLVWLFFWWDFCPDFASWNAVVHPLSRRTLAGALWYFTRVALDKIIVVPENRNAPSDVQVWKKDWQDLHVGGSVASGTASGGGFATTATTYFTTSHSDRHAGGSSNHICRAGFCRIFDVSCRIATVTNCLETSTTMAFCWPVIRHCLWSGTGSTWEW